MLGGDYTRSLMPPIRRTNGVQRKIVPIEGEIFIQIPGQSEVLLGMSELQRALSARDCIVETATLGIGRSHRPNENRVFPAGKLIGLLGQLECSCAVS